MEGRRLGTSCRSGYKFEGTEFGYKSGNEQFGLRQFTSSIRIIVLDFKLWVLILHVDGEGCAILTARYAKYMSYHNVIS